MNDLVSNNYDSVINITLSGRSVVHILDTNRVYIVQTWIPSEDHIPVHQLEGYDITSLLSNFFAGHIGQSNQIRSVVENKLSVLKPLSIELHKDVKYVRYNPK